MNTPVKGTSVQVILFSDNADTRRTVKNAVGVSLGKGYPRIEWVECATADMVRKEFKPDRFAAMFLDGEAQPEGGSSVARYLHNLTDKVPPIVMLIARDQDKWLARWAHCTATVAAPFDPLEIEMALKNCLR